MIIDSKKYSGTCTCGKDHSMTTEFCIIEPGCMKNIGTYIEKYGIAGSCAAIYDENTYSAFGGLRPVVGCEVVLPPENLHADNHAVAETLKKLPPDSDYLIALGSGTVHDITRYCAYKMGIPFVSCPSAASVDGFCSSVEDLSVIYKRLNMKSTLDDIGVDGKKESIIKEYSPHVRNRLTLMRLRRCGF